MEKAIDTNNWEHGLKIGTNTKTNNSWYQKLMLKIENRREELVPKHKKKFENGTNIKNINYWYHKNKL